MVQQLLEVGRSKATESFKNNEKDFKMNLKMYGKPVE